MILAWSSLLLGLTLFCFRAPYAFSNWVTPYAYLRRKFSWSEKTDRKFAFSSGAILLVCLLVSKFVLGGVFVTVAFRLWTSPFLFVVSPY